MQIENAVVLVTGANGGIGAEFVTALQQAGVDRIYACARKLASLSEVAATDPERIVPIVLDITDQSSIEAAVAQCQDVNLLINNAGVLLNYHGCIAAPSLDQARTEMEINYFGTLGMCRAFASILKANGGGAIINILSILARSPIPMTGSYSASKAAELSMTQTVRAELAAQGTQVIAVMPGTVDTEMSKNYPPPKVSPAEVAKASLQAVIDGSEEVYPGEQATQMAAQLTNNPKAVEKQFAQMLPST